ncbi:type II toxin-antitoxin system Phd/YefM family antitoxin [Arthrobacter sp. VKM Ac-2550]|uniref:type II toxin-antitoxin system Phd/YefM family antitoxin n=1 Tax=Crystallibacter permensis TaxID=1938888 RepID=UPI0022270BBB|nr:type II toxin-antitoxin system Phd/YefM family antitoxin [Arthrobacter sp. VKM Ac-2550]MCW2135086.1 hypothetical protein [Arthrobacter sp. VKM Ac-2550]
MTVTATITDLYRRPKEVLAHIDEGDVIITRQGKESLLVSRASAIEQDRKGLRLASALIAAHLGEGDFVSRLHVPFPWLVFLDRKDQETFASEVIDTTRGCASLGRYDRLVILISSWKATAEAVADGYRADGRDLIWLEEPINVERP